MNYEVKLDYVRHAQIMNFLLLCFIKSPSIQFVDYIGSPKATAHNDNNSVWLKVTI